MTAIVDKKKILFLSLNLIPNSTTTMNSTIQETCYHLDP